MNIWLGEVLCVCVCAHSVQITRRGVEKKNNMGQA